MERSGLCDDKTQVYDFIKIAAEICVVLQHITAMYSSHSAIAMATSSRALAAVYSVLAATTMPIFMCICGAVYNYCISIGKYRNRLKFAGNKFLRLMVPYLVFSVCTVAPVVVKLGITSWSFSEFLLYGTLMGGMTRHLWFCMSLFSIFIICAVFKNTMQRLSPLLLLPAVCVISFIGSSWQSPYFQLHQTLYFLLYFYLGVLIDRYWEGFCRFLRRLPFLSIPAAAALIGSVFVLEASKYPAALGGILLVFSVSVFVNTQRLGAHRLYVMMKRDSFGVYLLHPMILYVEFWLLSQKEINPYTLCIISFVGVYILTTLLTELIRLLHLGVIIGEKSKKVKKNLDFIKA